MRTAVLVSGGGTTLQALIDAQSRGELGSAEISLVVGSRGGILALERAQTAGIPTETVPRKQFDTLDGFDAAMSTVLERHNIEFIVLGGFLSMLGERVLTRYPRRIINVHPSLIPSFCGKGFYGLRVHEAALEYGVKITGATVHYVNEVYDGGAIIAQKAVDVLPGDTPEILQRRVMEQAEWVLLPKVLAELSDQMNGDFSPRL